MKKNFTQKLDNPDVKPAHKKTILDDINTIRPQTSSLKRQTFLLKEETIQKIKDFVYTQKINGDVQYTQKDLIEEALECLLANKTTIKRPLDFLEKRGRK